MEYSVLMSDIVIDRVVSEIRKRSLGSGRKVAIAPSRKADKSTSSDADKPPSHQVLEMQQIQCDGTAVRELESDSDFDNPLTRSISINKIDLRQSAEGGQSPKPNQLGAALLGLKSCTCENLKRSPATARYENLSVYNKGIPKRRTTNQV